MTRATRDSVSHWTLVLPALGFVAAISMQGIHFIGHSQKNRGPHLAQSVPAHVAGWSSRDVPLGQNEYLASEAEKVLNYDEVVYREFTRGRVTFGVYVAYWGAGKMPTRLVASHTPDRCWTENGWHCTAMKFRQPEAFEGRALQPAEWRTFEPPLGGDPTYVLYWHLVSGEVYDYGSRFNAVPDPLLWWKDAVQQIVMGNGEQYFIRLTSNEPLEGLWKDPGIAEILRGLGSLGLVAGEPQQADRSKS